MLSVCHWIGFYSLILKCCFSAKARLFQYGKPTAAGGKYKVAVSYDIEKLLAPNLGVGGEKMEEKEQDAILALVGRAMFSE